MAVTNLVIPYLLFTLAYAEASAGFVGLFAALIPMATAVFANAMLPNEPMTRWKLIGLSIGFAGVAALLASGDSGLASGGGGGNGLFFFCQHCGRCYSDDVALNYFRKTVISENDVKGLIPWHIYQFH